MKLKNAPLKMGAIPTSSNSGRLWAMGKRFLWTALIFVSVSMVGSQVYAQTNEGALAGTVTDPSGSAVAGAVVTAANAATGQSSKTTASPTGDYRFPVLLVGI